MSAPSAEPYRELHRQVFGADSVAEELEPGAPPPRPAETELQSRWFAGEFGRTFVTTRGLPVEIVQFGTWNHAAGPDFTEVAVRIGEKLATGCLELDWDCRDWERHGHAENPAYDRVVLHVFFEAAPGEGEYFTRTLAHRDVPQVRLDLQACSAGPPPPPAEAKCGRCSFPLETLPAASVRSLLASAARHRLDRKARRLERLAEMHGVDQALFQEMAAALGYRPNKLPMTVLAQRLPLKLLEAHRAGAEALLFGAAGFLETKIYEKAPPETQEYLRGLWETWWKHRDEFSAVTPPRWTLAGIRPSNHPHRRVAALALMAQKWRRLRQAFEAGEKALLEALAALEHAHWSHHYTLTSARSTKSLAVVGETRAAEMLANLAYPWWSLHRDTWWAGYERLPAALENEKSRRAALRLLGRRSDAPELTRGLAQQQALIQIYEDFCLRDHTDCAQCQFPEQLARWDARVE